SSARRRHTPSTSGSSLRPTFSQPTRYATGCWATPSSVASRPSRVTCRLFAHGWPGNVRALQNVMERAVLLAKSTKIEPVDLPFDNGSLPEKNAAGAGWDVPPNMTLEEIEKFVIERTLQRTNGNKQAAANLLGIYRPRLYSKIKKYKIG